MFYYLYVGGYMKEKLRLYIENNLVIEDTLFECREIYLDNCLMNFEEVPTGATYRRCKSYSINNYINEIKISIMIFKLCYLSLLMRGI